MNLAHIKKEGCAMHPDDAVSTEKMYAEQLLRYAAETNTPATAISIDWTCLTENAEHQFHVGKWHGFAFNIRESKEYGCWAVFVKGPSNIGYSKIVEFRDGGLSEAKAYAAGILLGAVNSGYFCKGDAQ